MQTQPLKQNCLVFGRLRHASLADLNAGSGWQNNVNDLDSADLIQHSARLIAQSRLGYSLSEHFPEYVGQETHEDVRLNTFFLLVPDGTNPQVAFLNPKSILRLRQLDVCFPQSLATPIIYVGPQEVTSLA